jgi:AraC-like DNA-binding protein
VLRDVPLGAMGPAVMGHRLAGEFVRMAYCSRFADELERFHRPGPAPYPEAYYAAGAKLYVDECATGNRHPIKTLAERLGLSEKRLRRVIYKARERGMLDGGQQGKAGGTLSPLAERLLRGKDSLKLIHVANESPNS